MAAASRDGGGALGRRGAAELQRVADVLGDRHVRVERVGLEDHRHVAVLRQHVGDVALADQHAAGGDGFEAGDHAQRRGLAAAGGAEQHEELAVGDGEVEALDHLDGAEGLADVGERHLHRVSP